jgi:hypothetical protein
MKKFQTLSALIILVSVSGFASAQSTLSDKSVLETAISATDIQIASSFADAMSLAQAVPVPVAPSREDAGAQALEAYFPLNGKTVYLYEYTSSEFVGAKLIRLEYINYSEKDHAVSVFKTITYNGVSRNEVYGVHANAEGVYSTDSIIGGKRMEFPLPAVVGKTWSENSDLVRIEATDAQVNVPAGTFRDCLQVTAGKSERYYAHGIGLVYEQVQTNDRQSAVKLLSYQIN